MRALLVVIAITLCGCQQSPTEFSPGARFYGCNVTEVPGGRLLQCPGAEDVPIMDGTDGTDGTNGTDGTDGTNGADGTDALVTIIDPCGDGPGADEVLLVYSGGRVVAWYLNVGLVELTANVAYVTTDAQHCRFSVTELGEVRYDQ